MNRGEREQQRESKHVEERDIWTFSVVADSCEEPDRKEAR